MISIIQYGRFDAMMNLSLMINNYDCQLATDKHAKMPQYCF